MEFQHSAAAAVEHHCSKWLTWVRADCNFRGTTRAVSTSISSILRTCLSASQLNQTVDNPFFGIITTGALSHREDQPCAELRPYPQFTDIIPLYSTGASSNYHALQVSFSKRFSRGFQFEGSYTWAKAIQEGLSHPNSYNLKMSRALADYDIAHRFVVSYIYELPFGRGRRLGASWGRPVDLIAGPVAI